MARNKGMACARVRGYTRRRTLNHTSVRTLIGLWEAGALWIGLWEAEASELNVW